MSYSQPVAVRPGRLIASTFVNIQKAGPAIRKPVTKSTTRPRTPPCGLPSDPRKPRTASMKQTVQLRMKPITVSSAALASTPAETQAIATQSACGAPEGSSIARKPPLRASEGKAAGGLRQTVIDFVTGFLIAGPAFWLFTKLLAINLPGLTSTGWL